MSNSSNDLKDQTPGIDTKDENKADAKVIKSNEEDKKSKEDQKSE